MKVVLKVTVVDRLLEEFAKAQRNNREVDFVAVTPQEMAELKNDLRSNIYVQFPMFDYIGKDAAVKVTYQARDFEYTGPRDMRGTQYQWRRFRESFDTFMGVPIFVVPEEYMPR